MKFRDVVNLIYAGLVLGVLFGAYKLIQAIIKAMNPTGTAAWWGAFFGIGKPPAHLEDLTGSLGQSVADSSQAKAAAAATPQLQYDQARSAFCNAGGISAAWGDPTALGWPWSSYDDWAGAGYPALPTVPNQVAPDTSSTVSNSGS